MSLSVSILGLLNKQYTHETVNALKYEHLASWADYYGLNNTAKLFRDQACGERGHAQKVADYINDRNDMLKMAPVQFDPPEIIGYQSAFDFVKVTEVATTDALKMLYSASNMEGDFLTGQWLRDLLMEQIEEENLVQTILDRIASREGSVPEVTGSTLGTEVLDNEDMGELAHDIDVWIGETFKG